MGSTSNSFFSKLMRSDGKNKKQKRNDVRKRNSMPAPEWFNTADPSSFLPNRYQDRPRDGNEPPLPATPGQRQDHRNQNHGKSTENSKKGKDRGGKNRRSSSLAFWLCMSGNADTLERGAQPLLAKPNGKGKKRENPQGNSAVNGVKLREKGKKGKKDPSKRHSAPASELFRAMEAHRNEDGNWNNNSGSGPSKTRYRVDGTLEKPYVFPSGLTFNGENRRSKGYVLRREIQPSRHGAASVEVHPSPMSARRRNFDGLEYDESEFSEDYDEFDVRKQFYLRYDSHRQKQSGGRRNRYSMPALMSDSGEDSHIYFGVNDDESFDSGSFMGQSTAANGRERDLSFRSGDLSGSEWEGRYDRTWRDQAEPSEKKANRYSLPPGDLGCVYMRHSNEHLEFVGLEEEEFQSGTLSYSDDLKRHKAGSGKRFSLPTESLEIRMFNKEESSSEESSAAPCGAKNYTAGIGSNGAESKEQESRNIVHEKQDSNESMDVAPQPECNEIKVTQSSPEETHIVPSASNCTDNCNDKSNNNEYNTLIDTAESPDVKKSTPETFCTTVEEIKREGRIPPTKDDVSNKPKFQKNRKQSPFSRNLGRASCMPGNKRFIPPPPPRHTPPRDVMDSAQAKLSGLVVHKECQTSLAGDTETLTMEEKDLSLKRGTTSPVYKQPSSHIISESTATSVVAESKNGIDTLEYIRKETDATFDGHEDFTRLVACHDERLRTIPLDENVDLNSHTSNISCANVPNSLVLQPSEQTSPLDTRNHSEVTDCHIKENTHHDIKKTTPERTPEVVQPGTGPDLAAVTSTPKASRRQKQMENKGMETRNESKPTPPPRKRLSVILSDVHNTSNISNGEEIYSRNERAQSSGSSTSELTPPVPRKRRNKIGTFKSASVDSPGYHISAEKPASHKLTVHDGVNDSVVCHSSAKSNKNKAPPTHNKDKPEVHGKMENLESGKKESIPVSFRTTKPQPDSEHDDSNIYEEIAEVVFFEAGETAENTSTASHRQMRNRPSPTSPSSSHVRRSSSHGLSKFTELLPPVADIMRLSASPRARRRYSSVLGSSSECLSPSPRPYFSGLSASLGDMLGAFDDATDSYRGHTKGRRCREKMAVRDDDAWAADDEMSVYDDAALKKSGSAGDLLRGTSIADRPLALSKRRHQKKYVGKYQRQLFSSTETDDGLLGRGSNDDIFDHPAKETSQWPSRKHRVNTTDSGLDSDFLSPSTSPDPRGNHLTQQGSEVIEECFKRQNSVQQKAWEIRLRRKQWLRRGRSKENLSASTPNLASFHSKSSTHTVV